MLHHAHILCGVSLAVPCVVVPTAFLQRGFVPWCSAAVLLISRQLYNIHSSLPSQLCALLLLATAAGAAAQTASSNKAIFNPAPDNLQPKHFTDMTGCNLACAKTGLTATWDASAVPTKIDSSGAAGGVTLTPGKPTAGDCKCPTMKGTLTTGARIVDLTPPPAGVDTKLKVELVMNKDGYAEVQVLGGTETRYIFNYYIAGCQAADASLFNLCQGSAILTYQSDSIYGGIFIGPTADCDRRCSKASYTGVATADLYGVFTPVVGRVTETCSCPPIGVTGRLEGTTLVLSGRGFIAKMSSASSTVSVDIFDSGASAGKITFAASGVNGNLAKYFPASAAAANGETTSIPTDSTVVGSTTTGLAAIGGGGSDSSTGAIVGGIIGGIVGFALLVVCVMLYTGKVTLFRSAPATVAPGSTKAVEEVAAKDGAAAPQAPGSMVVRST